MKQHLQNWWLAYGGAAVAVADKVWPAMRGYICTHPTISGATFLSIVVAALVKESPVSINKTLS